MPTARDHFDDEAERYPLGIGRDYTQNLKWTILSRLADEKAVVADIGAASGRHAIPMAELCRTVVALDLSPEMLSRLMKNAKAATRGGTIIPVVARLPDLPIAPGAFDLVFCFSTLLLLPVDQQYRAMAQMTAALKPGGAMVLDLANRRALAIHYWRRYYKKRGMEGIFGHDLPRLRSFFETQGLRIESLFPQGLLSQILLAPGLSRVPGLQAAIRGTAGAPGWDDALSRKFPHLAERWFIVVRKTGLEKT